MMVGHSILSAMVSKLCRSARKVSRSLGFVRLRSTPEVASNVMFNSRSCD